MPFEPQPTLRGKLVELLPLRPGDFPALQRAASDPLIWEQHPQSDRWKEEVFRGYFDSGIASGGAFLVRDATTGEVIGSTRYFGWDEAKSEVEIGWTFLVRSRWGGDFNREMKELMLAHAFRSLESVLFRVGPRNIRSQRAVEKIGGVNEGIRPDGRGGESVLFRISRPA